ncbi:hypothetical protein [Flavobacterium sp. HJSW_4]|uniref:hypothetical protein n=1 Tax=Flavobacterium sp. HJSW_4 TaxID=3344660 RepID=UPI0035F4163E
MDTNHNRIKVSDLETNDPDKILITNNNGELEFTNINDIKIDSYNGLDYTEEGKALDARQGKVLKDLIDNLKSFFETIFLGISNDQNVSGIKTFLNGKLGLRNVANTFTSFFTNSNTASRTYTLQNRNGTLLDNTDLSTINSSLATKQSLFTGTTNYIPKSLNSTTLGSSRLIDNGSFFGIDTTKSPLKDITLSNRDSKELGIEESANVTDGKNLTISAGRTINYAENTAFNFLQKLVPSYGMCSTTSGNIYIVNLSNRLYKQVGGVGPFFDTGITLPGLAIAICSTPTNDLYIAIQNGDIFKQTNETGPFVSTGQPNRNWYGLCSFRSNIYASVYNGDIYIQNDGSGPFIPTGQISRQWGRMAASSNNVYAVVGPSGGMYKQTGGTGEFTFYSSQSNNSILISKSNDIYVGAGSDILKQTNENGPFISTSSALLTSGGVWGMALHSNGNIYAGDFSGNIYMLQNNETGMPNLNGGTLKLKSGTGKGTGQSRLQFLTGEKTTSGTDMQIEKVRAYIDENGYMIWMQMPTYPDNASAIAGGLPIGCEYKTSTGDRKIVY